MILYFQTSETTRHVAPKSEQREIRRMEEELYVDNLDALAEQARLKAEARTHIAAMERVRVVKRWEREDARIKVRLHLKI